MSEELLKFNNLMIDVQCVCKKHTASKTYNQIIELKYNNLPLICPECGYDNLIQLFEIKKFNQNKNIQDYKLENIEEDNIDEDIKDLQLDIQTDILTRREEDATEKIGEYIKNNNYILTTESDIKHEIWFYQNGIYKPNGEFKIKQITRKLLGKIYTPQRVNKVIAKIVADTPIEQDKFFNTIHLKEIPVKNGILNLETLKLSKFTPEKIFFSKINAEYKPNATCENISKFFKDILKEEEDHLVVEELFGYCLYQDHFIEKAFMLVGDGRNGKGKLISLIKKLIGIENTCSVTLSQLVPGNTSVCELHGKLANLAGDLSNTSLKETGLFKEITGRDIVGAKRKYLNDLFFTNYSKQIFACNELPKVYDNSDGFWERWILLQFPFKFIAKDIYEKLDQKDKLKCKIRDVNILQKISTDEEMSGLLNLAISGLKRLKNKSDFSYTKGTKSIKDLWIRKSDSFHAFCIDNIEEKYEAYTPKKVIRKLFSDYCKIHKLKGASDKAIKCRLEDMYGVSEQQINIEDYGYSQFERVWTGIKLKNGLSFIKKDGEYHVSQETQGILKSTEI